MNNFQDTIVAIATPPGIGGVGIVRFSGQNALLISQKIFSSQNKNWIHASMNYGYVIDSHGENIDDGYAVYFQSPKSFTGEDVVEIQIHGSPYTLNQCVEVAVANGARLAGPGEFTQRAFINEKIDLIQAEAVSELIHAQSKVEAELSRKRLDGKLSAHIQTLRNQTVEVLAELDADVDFPEEELPLARIQDLVKKMESVSKQAKKILATYKQNQNIRDGFTICFVGSPNAGKSSFFNQLLQMDRAIVTDIEGTTRDTITESIHLNGHKVTLIDTAGLRQETSDKIENEGMIRSKGEIQNANLVCLIQDVQKKMDPELLNVLQEVDEKNRALIINKIDLENPSHTKLPNFQNTFTASSQTGEGVDQFLEFVKGMLSNQSAIEFGGGISNDRQRSLLEKMVEQIEKSRQALEKKDSPEFIAFEFRQAFEALNRLLGKDDGYEDVFNHIFTTFCIGK